MTPWSNPSTILLIMLVGLTPVFAGVFIAARKRELEHKERMKAIEMGMPIPGHYPWPAIAVIAIGAVVPVCAFAAALIATAIGPRTPNNDAVAALWSAQSSTAYYGTIWGGASGVGVTAVLAGAILAWRLMGTERKPGRRVESASDYAGKPVSFDPDAYDTVSRRG